MSIVTRIKTAGRTVQIVAGALALGTLTACATPGFNADVSRFSRMPVPQGQTFTVVPRDNAMANSLEFQSYAGLVAQAMERQGYRVIAPGANPDMVVKIAYGVDQGRERVVSDAGWSDPFWGPGWGYNSYYSRPYIVRTPYGYRYVRGFYDPFLYGPMFGDYGRVRSYTVYTSGLDMAIESPGGERLFEGSAEAVSRTNDLTRLVPNLVQAMFTGFPGNTGERVRITVAPDPVARR